ncbi:MAG: chloride channel protein [Pirellulales bacterium]|nr:chloride channel protein [Pirellulales bacterium]
MNGEKISPASTNGLPVSPALDLAIEAAQVPTESNPLDRRVVWICGLALVIGVMTSFVAVAFLRLIALVTNISFYGSISLENVTPADNNLGLWVLLVPVVGAFIVGLMARYGSQAIRGHGLPEAMEQVLTNQSRIPARITFLKPISAAVAIGTGGPFGAEGPIIATGGALGSLIGQFLRTSASERKTLLAVGAAAGTAAIFNSPVAAVLLAVELLLFEFRARSLVPVALGSVAATGMRMILFEGGEHPVFPMPDVTAPTLEALAFFVALGAVMGVAAAFITRLVYAIEDIFERLPIHWMWWPMVGAVAVGICGYFVPATLGVGYDNITTAISDVGETKLIGILALAKLISWSISIGSGTSGGTMAPLFTIGAGFGNVLGAAAAQLLPSAAIDVRVAALVGMAAMFAGASRALLASAVFAFETTWQPFGLLPLLGGCAASYLVSALLSRHSLMTEKIARRGVNVPVEYASDPLEQITVGKIASKPVVTLQATQTVEEARQWLKTAGADFSHQGFPIVNTAGALVGIITRRDLAKHKESGGKALQEIAISLPRFVYESTTARQAADHMVNHSIGRLPVVTRQRPPRVVGIVTRSDILMAYRHRMNESMTQRPTITIAKFRRRTIDRKNKEKVE